MKWAGSCQSNARKTRREEVFSVRQIETIQKRAWLTACHYAYARSPFYRNHFRQAGVSPRIAPPLDCIADIPPIDKDILSNFSREFLCVPREKVIDIVTTSGSTGEPLVWMLTEMDLQRLAYNEYLSFRCAGLFAGQTVLLAVTLDRCFIAGMAYYLGLRWLGCSMVRVGPSSPVMHLDMLQRLKPSVIVGVPSFLGMIAEKAVETGLQLSKLGVTKLVCIGEPIRQANFALNRCGQDLQEQWKAGVFSTYGVTELASSLCECEAGCGGHLHPELLFLEALDDHGRAVPDGEVGELTATTFGVEGMPLVRYRTGDCAAIYRDPCRCGRCTPRLGPVVGRKSQKLKIKGTTIFPSTLKAVLDSTAEVSSYVIVARRENPLADLVEVRIACSKDSIAVARRLRERFQGEAKVTPHITVAKPAAIESLQLPDGARKRRYFVDLRG